MATKFPTTFKEIQALPQEKQIEALEKAITYHNKKYFIDNQAEIPDEEFDQIVEMLKEIRPDSPALYELVGEIGNVQHPVPMLSLDKKYTYDDVKKWVEDINDEKYVIEPKYDGMAARYQSGVLATRGDGYYGEDISNRLKDLNIKGELPTDNSSVYGEIIIPLSYFNEHLAGPFKNPRNAAVGIVKAKNIRSEGIKALRDGGVHFVLHDQAKKITVTKEELLDEEQWESILEQMFQLDYPLDGIVIKATNDAIKRSMAATQHHEKWQVAYKSPAERKWSVVREINDQVGRTGRITSVAVIDPIQLSGATVTNVTLHNYDYIRTSKIGIGSKVEVCRSGEVIPFITQVIPAKTPHKLRTTCPICKTPLREMGKYTECPNKNCPARKSQSFEYFFKVLGVEELGLKTIQRFINEFKVDSIDDFYKLKPEQIAELEGFGQKSAIKITQNIKATLHETIKPEQLIQALGIAQTGPATSRWIVNHFGFDNLPKLTAEDLADVKGVGEVKARHFVHDLHAKWPIVVTLQKMGLKFEKENKTNKLGGSSFAITGKKGRYSRDELVEIINKNGGEYKSSITKGLTYLIAGDDAGSKLEKAAKLDVKVITEDDFLTMVK